MRDSTVTQLRDRVLSYLHTELPQIKMHGGAVTLHECDPDRGVLRIELTEQCNGCGLAPMTITALEQRVQAEFPEFTDVVATTAHQHTTQQPQHQ
ncbi:NifU family protein [Salinibaculum rarum]|uniref:NifU family protein n=1 Tax=Salinibaculum rarum TaxID=3058903 RepID=UPI0026600D8D|nr:NifU family protein [Salinibaculum sp. KK48]